MKQTLAALIVVAALSLVSTSAGQDVRPVPGPGTGIVVVKGTVDIGNTPVVTAAQAGDWRVSLANTPDVRVAGLEFLKPGRRYQVTWSSERSEEVVVAQLGSGGWTRVESSSGRRWINLDEAQAVEELSSAIRR